MPYDVNHVLEHAEVAGWVLGVLDPAEARGFESHLRSCRQCQAAAAEFEPVAKALGRAAPAAEPPHDLRARTIASVLAAAGDRTVTGDRAAAGDRDATRLYPIPPVDAPAVSQAPPGPGEHEPGEQSAGARVIRFPRWPGRGRLLAIAGVVAAAVVAALVILPGRGGAAATFQLAAAPGQTGSAVATVRSDASGSWDVSMTVRHLKNLGDVPFYECWYVGRDRSGRVQYVSAGTFVVGNDGTGSFSMTSAADPTQFRAMEITAQLSGSTTQPGRVILTGTTSAQMASTLG